MSVIASKRNPSKFEPIKHAVDLRILFAGLLVRNFGVRRKDSKEEKYIFLMASCKDRINYLAIMIEANTRAANTIYPVNLDECAQRREYQNNALANCEQMISELQYVVNIFEVNLNQYKQYVEAIDRQISLLKKWRQSDNRIRNKLIKGGI